MESRESKAYWERYLRECTLFSDKVKALEELILFIDRELSQSLGDESGDEVSEKEEETQEEDLLEAFVSVLEALWEKEKNTLRAPKARRKALRGERVWNLEDLTLQDLLALYTLYFGRTQDARLLPDRAFEELLERRRCAVLSLCAQGGDIPLSKFFEDCSERRAVIATFLVLLDLVFRRVLVLKQEKNGGIYLGRAESKSAAESP